MVYSGIGPRRAAGLTAAAALALLGASACSSSGSAKPAASSAQSTSPAPSSSAPSNPSSSGASSSAPAATQSSVMTGSAAVNGTSTTVLVAQDGKTLYYFTPDTAGGMPTCTGTCAQAWPPLTVAAPTAGSGVTGMLKVVTGVNGDQVTYNGHPLYEYTGDQAAGQANGQGVLGKWYAATPALAAGAGAPAAGTTGGSSGSTGGSTGGSSGGGNGGYGY